MPTSTWNWLAPQAGSAPKRSAHPGRVHVVQGWTTHQTQVLLLTDTEAAAWVTTTAARGPAPRPAPARTCRASGHLHTAQL
ncbi:hypothetical protein [Streptomyces mirabilis]|uniref:hypothetical protein n=1 Tax=Streptomyces mirabilis TaxID=68239 RepID=UPI0036BC4E80